LLESQDVPVIKSDEK